MSINLIDWLINCLDFTQILNIILFCHNLSLLNCQTGLLCSENAHS